MNDIDFLKASDGTGEAVRAIVTGTRAALATTLAVDSVNNWPTNFIATIGTLNGSTGIIESSSVTIFKGHLSGGDIIIDTIAPGYTDVGNSVGQVVVLKPNTFWADTMVAAMTNIHADSITINGSQSAVGWNPLGIAQSGTITNNGNRSYDIPFATTVADVLNPGMRLRIPRTVTAPTQSTSLNGTTQYYSKAAPAGMTFTDDFTCSAWVKLSAYPTSGIATIISRYSGADGWVFYVDTSGRLVLFGDGVSNRSATSYQSLPLNKWVHVAATLDMSAGDTTASAVYIDGVSVPRTYTGAGTALTQAGSIGVGGDVYAGADLFTGKIAQAAVYSAILTQATIRSQMSQGLTGTETSLISAYSFNGVITDLNTTNANNLTANAGAVATNADSPFTVDANGVAGGTYEFAIVTKVATNIVTVQVPEGCAIPTSGGVGSIDYSTVATPYGFPSKDRFNIELHLISQVSTSGTTVATIYNPGGMNISLPIARWNLSGEISTQTTNTSTINSNQIALSPSSTLATDTRFGVRDYIAVLGSGSFRIWKAIFLPKLVNATAITPYYILYQSDTSFSAAEIRGANTISGTSMLVAELDMSV